jgi:hypothetical protein
LIKDLEKDYFVEVLEKNKGFFVIKCKIRWLVDDFMLII